MIRELLDFVMNSDAFRIEEFPATIGRSCESIIQLNDRFASRVHCLIERSGERFSVTDLNSHHGTRLNDDEISHAEIEPGDRLQIGLHVFRVNIVRQKLLFRRTHGSVYHGVSMFSTQQGEASTGASCDSRDNNVAEESASHQDDLSSIESS